MGVGNSWGSIRMVSYWSSIGVVGVGDRGSSISVVSYWSCDGWRGVGVVGDRGSICVVGNWSCDGWCSVGIAVGCLVSIRCNCVGSSESVNGMGIIGDAGVVLLNVGVWSVHSLGLVGDG
jgi:hypothetical protein